MNFLMIRRLSYICDGLTKNLLTMKKILLSATALLSFATLNAQLLTANDAASFTNWSAVDGDGDTYTWGLYDLTGAGTALDAQGECAISFSWGDPDQPTAAPLTPDNWLVSPVINLTGTSTPTLVFSTGATDSTYFAENYSVYAVSAADPSTLPAILPTLTPIFTETIAVGAVMTAHTVSLSSVAGQNNVYIAFRHYNCTNEYTLVLDDVYVSASAGIEEENNLVISAFPNPANDVLNITMKADASTVAILAMDGKVISKQNSNSSVIALDLSALTSGVYMYEVVSESGTVIRNTFVKK